MHNHVFVGLNNFEISRDTSDILVTLGLGSCLAVGMHDPTTRITGLLHAQLPTQQGNGGPRPKYVDSGILALIEQMKLYGANRRGLVVHLAGGAHLIPSAHAGALNIGACNVSTALEVLTRQKILIASRDIGGNVGRTIRLRVADGQMSVRLLKNPHRVEMQPEHRKLDVGSTIKNNGANKEIFEWPKS